jgi:hypothetical protein
MTTSTTITALSVACPICDAQPSQPCRNIVNRESRRPHVHRAVVGEETAR